jgi:uncharacterized protein (DUF305 family)
LATSLLLTSCSGVGSVAPAASSSDEPVITGEPAGYNTADVTFATNMVMSHQQAVQMSALVAGRSGNPDITQLAADISAALPPEVEMMNVLTVQWKENPDSSRGEGGPGATLRGMVDGATLQRLSAMSGTEFDSLWLTTMIAHHQGAIEMAEAETADGENVDAVDLAKRIAGAHQGRIVQMQRSLADGQ